MMVMEGFLKFSRLTFIIDLYFSFVLADQSKFVKPELLCEFNTNSSGEIWTNCSNLKLSSVSINISVSTTHLILSNNLIKTIKPGNFKLFENLTYLDISNSLLKTMDSASFATLTKLKVLNIFENDLSNKTSFPNGVFKPLSSSLLELDMRHNLMDLRITQGMYPDEALADLRSLKVLKIDCIRGEHFSDMILYVLCIYVLMAVVFFHVLS